MLKRLLFATLMFTVLTSDPASASDSRTPVTALPNRDSNSQSILNTGGNDGESDSSAENAHTFGRTVSNKPIDPRPVVESNCDTNNGIDASDLTFVDGGEYDMCVRKLTIHEPTPSQSDIVQAVKNFYQSTALPIPIPEISAKNGGICGVRHTLDLHIPVSKTFQYPGTDFGNVEIIVHAAHTRVDWGDGTENDYYGDTGGPWPNSNIGHVWTVKGTYNITVDTEWTAEWTVLTPEGATYGGVLSGLSTNGSIPAFTVIQAQAVLTN